MDWLARHGVRHGHPGEEHLPLEVLCQNDHLDTRRDVVGVIERSIHASFFGIDLHGSFPPIQAQMVSRIASFCHAKCNRLLSTCYLSVRAIRPVAKMVTM